MLFYLIVSTRVEVAPDLVVFGITNNLLICFLDLTRNRCRQPEDLPEHYKPPLSIYLSIYSSISEKEKRKKTEVKTRPKEGTYTKEKQRKTETYVA